MRKYIITGLLISAIFPVSCEKFLQPQPESTLSEEEIVNNPGFAEGLLLTAYYNLPGDYDFSTDVASDDAVTNDKGSEFRQMATGNWKASNNPVSKWNYCYEQIYYTNKFLEIYSSVRWANDLKLSKEDNDLRDSLYKKRLKGEAYGLRAWYKWMLLQYHAGKDNQGRLLGYPIVNRIMQPEDQWDLPRNTLVECIADVFSDLDTAIANLPKEWADTGTPLENAAMGARYQNRINGYTAKALKSRIALLAASPAFAEANAVSWEEAAVISGELLSEMGSLYNKGIAFYQEISNHEIIWNRAKEQIRSWEEENFPPSLFGLGRTDPSQNLVDAFPMANGYPVNNPLSGFDPLNPFANRDPRLNSYIIRNASVVKNTPVNTWVGAPKDGINSLVTSTRTGYYLKKFMDMSVSLTPGNPVSTAHTYTLMRMTEILLNFAEAANEAWGPDGDPKGFGFTARSKIAELRARAGLTPDDYLGSVSTKSGMRELIHNERRLELCFEGFRFWDIRRWNETDIMTSPVKGVYITIEADSSFAYSYQIIEDRKFSPYMIYGPLPYEETLKYNIEQNAGW